MTERERRAGGRVRLVVLNHDGGALLERCFDALGAVDWPADELELVLVDNASSDGSVEAVVESHPQVRVIRSPTNTGFPANNLALDDLHGVRYVGLVNNDAFVEPGWVRAMVDALDADVGLGAATGRLVFAPRFLDVQIDGSQVRITGLRVDGVDRWRGAQVVGAASGPDPDERGGVSYETSGPSTLRVPVDHAHPADEVDVVVEVRLHGAEPRQASLDGGRGVRTVEVGTTPAWFELPVGGRTYDVVHNAGGVVFDDGYGADRGFLEVDAGQFDEAVEVFSWCGGGVLLRPSYLQQVGLFEETFFLYYEDTDLSWRGRAAGWRYEYVPGAIARHVHSASSGVGSALFMHYTERNRLLMLARNAPWPMALRAVVRFVLVTGSYRWRSTRPGSTLTARRRLGALVDFGRMLPATIGQRRRLRRRQTVPDQEIARWLTHRDPGPR